MTDTFPNTADFDISDFTPAMRQFVEVKRRYPAMLVLFRMGDFYETFFEDARKANRLIGITLTKRGKLRDGTDIPMAGIPAVSLDSYVQKLVALGESVVIAEQLGTPGKGLMERKISRIITREYEQAEVRTLLVIDATTGQNGLQQAREFASVADVSGIVLTKLDGTAKGGIAVAIMEELKLPVLYIGVGEGIEDLQAFDAGAFVDAIF